jgi:hypothetical protein
MALTPDKLFVLIVALLTWGGVYAYLLRLDRISKVLEEQASLRESETAAAKSTLSS